MKKLKFLMNILMNLMNNNFFLTPIMFSLILAKKTPHLVFNIIDKNRNLK